MGEIVTKEDFWQIILNDTSQFGQITTEDKDFNEMSSFVWTVVQNTLVDTKDDNYIKSYEDMIGISGEGLTQYQRKVNVLYMLTTKNYLALNLIKRSLINMGLGESEVEHVKEENKVVVHTDRIKDDKLATIPAILNVLLPKNIGIEQYNHHIEVSWRDINKYAECTNVTAMNVVNPDWRNDLTSDGEWWWNLSSIKEYSVFSNNQKITLFNAKLNKEYHSLYTMFNNCSNLREIHGDFSNFSSIGGMCNGCVKLSVFTPVTPRVNEHYTGPGMVFSGCILNKKSVLSFLGALPTANRSLGIGIHIDHQNDEEVLEAIANAEAKGWTLTVQWNGTPTTQASATYGLRKPPIYAKVAGMERSSEGTSEQYLDWGHYVTKPEDYQEFSSLGEAYEHFGLEKPTFEE